MPAKKPDAPEEVTMFESIKNRIAERSQLIVDLRQTVADKDEEILALGVRVEDAEKATETALAQAIVKSWRSEIPHRWPSGKPRPLV